MAGIGEVRKRCARELDRNTGHEDPRLTKVEVKNEIEIDILCLFTDRDRCWQSRPSVDRMI